MIDLHMHILAGMDDGASSIQEAVRMAEIASDCRVKAVAATCHAHFLLRREKTMCCVTASR